MTLGIIVGSVAISPLPDLVGDVFGVGAAPSTNPVTGKPQLSFFSLAQRETPGAAGRDFRRSS